MTELFPLWLGIALVKIACIEEGSWVTRAIDFIAGLAFFVYGAVMCFKGIME